MQVICEPGVVHAQLNEQLAPHHLVFPPDPGSSRMATVGGMASTNAHGMRAVKYGPTSAWVLGLEVVLPDGELIETGSVGSRAKQSSAGLELTKLIVGAEGTLGVITRLRLKLMPIPPARAIVLGLFDVLEKAGQAVQAVFGAGSAPQPSRSWTSAASRRSTSTARRWACRRSRRCSCSRWTATRRACAGTPRRSVEVVEPLARDAEWSDEPTRIAALWEAALGGRRGGRRAAAGSNRAYCGEDLCVPVSRIPETLRAIQDIALATAFPSPPTATSAGAACTRLPDRRPRLPTRSGASCWWPTRSTSSRCDGRHRHGRARRRRGAGAVHGRRAWAGPGRDAPLKRALDPKGIMNPGGSSTRRPALRVAAGRPGRAAIRTSCTDPPGSSIDFLAMTATPPGRRVRSRTAPALRAPRRGRLVTFNRPQARNALTGQDRGAVRVLRTRRERRSRARAGAPGAGDKAFVAGTDISQFKTFTTPRTR